MIVTSNRDYPYLLDFAEKYFKKKNVYLYDYQRKLIERISRGENLILSGQRWGTRMISNMIDEYNQSVGKVL